MLRRIGGGSYGSVWLARTATGIYRAVKVVWRDGFEDAEPYEREFRGLREFERVSLTEARQLALLHVGRRDEERFFYYVMELADDVERGREIDPDSYRPLTLREMPRSGPLSVERVVQLGVELARGLAVLHDRELVHRDIKPSNVIVVNGEPKLADIGLVASSTLALTFVGTEGFVAPEGPGSPAGDVYALGKVLYELATGLDRLRFPELPEGFTERRDRLAFLELNAVILRACEPDLKRRHPDARALLEDLLMVQAGKSVRRLRAAERGLARALQVVVVLAAVAAVAGGGAWVAWSRAQHEMALRSEAEAERDALARRMHYAGLMAQASRAVERGEMGFARSILAEARSLFEVDQEVPLEWRLLRGQAEGEAERFLRAAGAPVKRLVLRPDGAELAAFDLENGVVLLDAETGAERGRLAGAADLGGYAADGRGLWGVDEAGRPTYWETASGEAKSADYDGGFLWPLSGEQYGGFLGVERVSPGRRIVWDGAGGVRELGRLLPDDGEDWKLFRAEADEGGRRGVVAWVAGDAATATFLITAWRGDDVWSTAARVRPGSVAWFEAAGEAPAVEWANDLNGQWERWTPGAGVPQVQRGELGENSSVRFAGPGGRGVRRAVGSHWEWVGPDGAMRTLRGHGGKAMEWEEDEAGQRAYSASETGEIIRWSLREGLAAQEALPSAALRVQFTAGGSRLLVPSKEGGVRVWSIPDRAWVDTWEALGAPLAVEDGRAWGVDASGCRIVGCDDRTGAVNWSPAEAGKALALLQVGVAPAGQGWVYSKSDHTVWVGGPELPSPRWVTSVTGYRWALNLDRNLAHLWCTGGDGRLECHDLSAGTIQWSRPLPTLAADVVLSPDEKEVAAALENGEVWFWEAASGRLLRRLQSGTAAAEVLLYSINGDRLLVGGNDGTVQVFETETWSHVVALATGGEAALGRMVLAPGDEALAVVDQKGRFAVLTAKPAR